MKNAYKRVLLKLSGEALKGDSNSIFSSKDVERVTLAIKKIVDRGVQVGIVVGAGNIWRGKLAQTLHMEPSQADYMGMLGTVINAMALESSLKNVGVDAITFSALDMLKVVDSFSSRAAKKAFDEGKVCIFAGGTGSPFFTTDTCAALRACETNCDAVLMAKNGVDGVYSKDPNIYKDAIFYKNLTYQELLEKNLGVMDSTAVSLLMNKNIDLRVFSMQETSNFEKVLNGEDIGTTIRKGDK